jgi:hypothetical protein
VRERERKRERKEGRKERRKKEYMNMGREEERERG